MSTDSQRTGAVHSEAAIAVQSGTKRVIVACDATDSVTVVLTGTMGCSISITRGVTETHVVLSRDHTAAARASGILVPSPMLRLPQTGTETQTAAALGLTRRVSTPLSTPVSVRERTPVPVCEPTPVPAREPTPVTPREPTPVPAQARLHTPQPTSMTNLAQLPVETTVPVDVIVIDSEDSDTAQNESIDDDESEYNDDDDDESEYNDDDESELDDTNGNDYGGSHDEEKEKEEEEEEDDNDNDDGGGGSSIPVRKRRRAMSGHSIDLSQFPAHKRHCATGAGTTAVAAPTSTPQFPYAESIMYNSENFVVGGLPLCSWSGMCTKGTAQVHRTTVMRDMMYTLINALVPVSAVSARVEQRRSWAIMAMVNEYGVRVDMESLVDLVNRYRDPDTAAKTSPLSTHATVRDALVLAGMERLCTQDVVRIVAFLHRGMRVQAHTASRFHLFSKCTGDPFTWTCATSDLVTAIYQSHTMYVRNVLKKRVNK